MSTRSSRSFTQRSRERIKAAKILERLLQFVNGEIKMTRQQAQIGMKLLDKVLPTLRAISIEELEPESKSVRDMTDEKLLLEMYRTPGGKEAIYQVLDHWRAELLGAKRN